jgi:hypothetical protein
VSSNLSAAAVARRNSPIQEAFGWGDREQAGYPPEHEENLEFVNVLRAWLRLEPLRDEVEF